MWKVGALLLSEMDLDWKKRRKSGLFLFNSDNLHKNRGLFIVNFALVLYSEIGYNVVTKVTVIAFGCHNYDESVSEGGR